MEPNSVAGRDAALCEPAQAARFAPNTAPDAPELVAAIETELAKD